MGGLLGHGFDVVSYLGKVMVFSFPGSERFE